MVAMVSLYDDTYDGPRWRYGLQYRGITQYMGCRDDNDDIIPWIVFSGKKHDDPRFRNFGTYETAAEIPETTVQQLQLVALGKVG